MKYMPGPIVDFFFNFPIRKITPRSYSWTVLKVYPILIGNVNVINKQLKHFSVPPQKLLIQPELSSISSDEISDILRRLRLFVNSWFNHTTCEHVASHSKMSHWSIWIHQTVNPAYRQYSVEFTICHPPLITTYAQAKPPKMGSLTSVCWVVNLKHCIIGRIFCLMFPCCDKINLQNNWDILYGLLHACKRCEMPAPPFW